MVAHHAHLPEVKRLRNAIPISTKMWLNALSGKEARTYSSEELELCRSIDPFFDFSASPRPSKGQPCRSGSESLSIDEFGDIRRCHFLPKILGNIAHHLLEDVLREEPCTRRVCDCFIGYSQRRDLPIFDLFGEGLMARMAP
jgi:MoaA/NifB/PqqE/SkfB family radical SAM enzyme